MSKVSLSARAVLEVLAGRRTGAGLAEEFGFDGTADRPETQPFGAALASGRTMRGARVTRLADADDDVIEFEFDGPNPAVWRLIAPGAKG